MFPVGRKNGKSTLLAAIALYMLIADYEGASEIYSVATKKNQAKKVLTEAVNMVKRSPELRAVLRKRRNDLYFTAMASILKLLRRIPTRWTALIPTPSLSTRYTPLKTGTYTKL